MDDTISLPRELELAALVLMLCGPSELNWAWTRSEQARTRGFPHDADGVLNDLPFSEHAKELARGLMQQPDAKVEFAAVAERLKPFWPREPHPDSGAAKTIITAIRNAPVPA